MHSSLELGMFLEEATILVTIVGTVGMFSTLPMLVCASWHHREQKIQHWEGKSTTICRYAVFAPGFPTYCDEDCSSSSFGDKTISL